MLLIGVVLGLAGGLLAGGHIQALVNVRLRFLALLLTALILRYGTQLAIAAGVPLADTLRLPLYATAFGLLVGVLWLNRSLPGLAAVMVGVAANGLAMVLNQGWMPIYLPALAAAGISPTELGTNFFVPLPLEVNLQFVLQGGPIADIIPFPVPILTNVLSVGDIFISAGLGWFIFATLIHGEPEPVVSGPSLWTGRTTSPEMTSDRPMVLGGGMGPGLAPPGAEAQMLAADAAAGIAPPAVVPALGWGARARGHPYVRLARDARFSAFWIGQTISLFGDRLHQVALAVMAFAITGSALQTGLVFLAATLPNLLLGPFAGPFVDRWDQKRVMVVSDVLRAGLVVLIPIAAQTNFALVYPLVFLVTTVSLFFRPAKTAVVPRIVASDDLMAANSAIWTGETVADIAGYPLAGLLVGFLGTQLALAFWLDAATYVISAILILGITIPPVARTIAPRMLGAIRSFVVELREGWQVLRGQPTLFQNTLISTVAQVSVGTTLALTVVYAKTVLDGTHIPYPENYASIDAAIGIGNLVGGIAVGAVGARLRKGWLVVTGFVVMGGATVVLGLTSNVLLALVAALIMGIFNLVYIVPTQTLFGELTPPGYMGRVVAFRSSMVFGAMTLAMAIGSALAESVPVGLVIAGSGAITLLAGALGAFLPAVRNA